MLTLKAECWGSTGETEANSANLRAAAPTVTLWQPKSFPLRAPLVDSMKTLVTQCPGMVQCSRARAVLRVWWTACCFALKWSSGREAKGVTCSLNCEASFFFCFFLLLDYEFNYYHRIGGVLNLLCLLVRSFPFVRFLPKQHKVAIAVRDLLLGWRLLGSMWCPCEMFAAQRDYWDVLAVYGAVSLFWQAHANS